GTAEGLATLNIEDGLFPFVEGLRTTPVQMLAPSFFTADGTGTGAAAATAVRVLPNGTQIPVPVFQCSNGRCSTVPIDFEPGAGVPQPVWNRISASFRQSERRSSCRLSDPEPGSVCNICAAARDAARTGSA